MTKPDVEPKVEKAIRSTASDGCVPQIATSNRVRQPVHMLLLSGYIAQARRSYVLENSISAVDYSADGFQHGLLRGLQAIKIATFENINLTFLGSYPSRFKLPRYIGSGTVDGEGRIVDLSFLNVAILKHFVRFFHALRALYSRVKDGYWIIVYSTHLPFLLASLIARVARPGVRICVVVPDLPEFLHQKSGLAGALHQALARVTRMLLRKCDAFVVLTGAMIKRLGIEPSKAIVIEGIWSPVAHGAAAQVSKRTRAALYAGTLAARYGIRRLVDAFVRIPDPNFELWICGEGDSKDYVVEVAARDPRIKYFGQVDRLTSINLQRSAFLLVNPRESAGEYTEYSFPSKIIEYYASGRPVLMNRLPGIPAEYYSYCITPEAETQDDLRLALEAALLLDESVAADLGARAQRFLLDRVSAESQAERLASFLSTQ